MISAGESVSPAGKIVAGAAARADATCCACPRRPARCPAGAPARRAPSCGSRQRRQSSGSDGRLSLTRQQIKATIAGLLENDAGLGHELAYAPRLTGSQKAIDAKLFFYDKRQYSCSRSVSIADPRRPQTEASSAIPDSQGYRRDPFEKHSSCAKPTMSPSPTAASRSARCCRAARRRSRRSSRRPQGGDAPDRGRRGGGEICAGDRPRHAGHRRRRACAFAQSGVRIRPHAGRAAFRAGRSDRGRAQPHLHGLPPRRRPRRHAQLHRHHRQRELLIDRLPAPSPTRPTARCCRNIRASTASCRSSTARAAA